MTTASSSSGEDACPTNFAAHGYAVVPHVLPSDVVDRLIDDIESLRAGSSDKSYAGMRNLLSQSVTVRDLARSESLRGVVEPILGPRAFATRALLFDKCENANWWVGWHQDQFITVREKREVPGFHGFWRKEGVLHVIPPADVLVNMLTVRVHLDDCTADNGALQVVAGSHAWGLLTRDELTERTKSLEVVTCEVPRGGVLLMRPLILHASQKAIRPEHRRVIHLEYAAHALPGGLAWNESC